MRRRAGRGAVLEHGRDFLLRHARHVLLLCGVVWLLQAGGRAAAAAVPTPPSPPTSPKSTTPPKLTTPLTTTPTTTSASESGNLTKGDNLLSREQTTFIGYLDAVKDLDESMKENGGQHSRKDFNNEDPRDDEMKEFFSNINEGNMSHTGVYGSDVGRSQNLKRPSLTKSNIVVKHDEQNSKDNLHISFGKIKNGKTIDIAARPWSVHIWVTQFMFTAIAKNKSVLNVNRDVPPHHICTGSLVGKRHVLFAAHCIDNVVLKGARKVFKSALKIKLFVGRNSVDNTSKGGIELTVQENKNLFYHESYTKLIEARSNLTNKCLLDISSQWIPDIAILKLDRSALGEPDGDKAAVIALPKGKELEQNYFYGRECFATGAGLTEKLESGTLYDAPINLRDPLQNITGWIKLLKEKAKFSIDGIKELNIDTDSYLKKSIPECVEKHLWYATRKDDPKLFFGDSGGPLACRGENGGIVLAGVAHRILFERNDTNALADKNTAPVIATIHYRTAPYVSWINSVIGVAADNDSKVKGGNISDLREDSASHGAPRPPARAARALAASLTMAVTFGFL